MYEDNSSLVLYLPRGLRFISFYIAFILTVFFKQLNNLLQPSSSMLYSSIDAMLKGFPIFQSLRAPPHKKATAMSMQSLVNAAYMTSFLAAKAVPVVAVGSSIVFAISPWCGVPPRGLPGPQAHLSPP
jgi:hypothetical protein